MLYNIMPENLYPQLPTAPPISQESFNIEMVRKYYQDMRILKNNILESNENIRMLTIDYYMHLQVQVLLLYLVAFQLLERQSPLWDFL